MLSKTGELRGCRAVELVEVTTLQGNGTVADVAREVRFYFWPDGRLAAIDDPCPDADTSYREPLSRV